MTYTNTEQWSLLHQIDQLDNNYSGLTNDHRQVEARRMAEGRNLIEQTVAYDATAACTFLNLLDRRDDAIRCNDRFAYHHVDEAANLLRSIHPQLPADEPYPYGEPDNDGRHDDEPGTHDLSSLPFCPPPTHQSDEHPYLKEPTMHDIRINATPSLLATIAARLPKDHQVEIRLSVDDHQFQNLDLDQPVNQLLFSTGKSSDELPTTIGARDVAHIQGCNTTQSHLITAFFHSVGEPRPTQDRMDADALQLDDMTTQAVEFMLSLHEQYMDPTSDADEQELVDLAQQKGLTLDDYYRASVAA